MTGSADFGRSRAGPHFSQMVVLDDGVNEYKSHDEESDVLAERGMYVEDRDTALTPLNLVRNTCAHHGRLFNRVHTLSPKLPPMGQHSDLAAVATDWSRTFGQLTMVRFLLDRLQVGRQTFLPTVLKTFPSVQAVPITHVGATSDWSSASSLWSR